MKQIFRILLFIAAVLTATQSAQAVRYRGFIEGAPGVIMYEGANLRFDIQTSHGFQFSDKFYLGLAAEVNFQERGPNYGILLHTRWDFNTNKLHPYMDMKFGGIKAGNDSGNDCEFTLGFGLRQKLGTWTGINYGLSVGCAPLTTYESGYSYEYYEFIPQPMLKLSIGLDF